MRSYFKKMVTAILLLIFSLNGLAQSEKAVPGKSIINLAFDENGKLIDTLPAGFTLLEKQSYTFNIRVEKPVKQQKDLLKFLGGKLKKTLRRLNDPEDLLAGQFKSIYSESRLMQYKEEIKLLITVFESNNPDSALKAAPGNFDYFLGKKFLQENLFGKIFTVYNSLTNSDTSLNVTSDLEWNGKKIAVTTDSLVVDIRVADLTKQFIRKYYLESIRQQEPKFTDDYPQNFYKNNILKLLSFKISLDSIARVLKKPKNYDQLICDDEILRTYNALKAKVDDNAFLKIVHSNWMSRWLWYTEGKWQINPLGFTDGELISFPPNDTTNAGIYDKFISSSINLMAAKRELSQTGIDYKMMDSLLEERRKGNERFSNEKINAGLVTANNALSKKMQAINTTVNRLKFKIISDKEAQKYYIRSYNADQNLKGYITDKKISLPVDMTVDLVGYNISQNQELTLKETSLAIPDQSKAIASINEVGDVASPSLENAGKISPVITNLLSVFIPPDFKPYLVNSVRTDKPFGLVTQSFLEKKSIMGIINLEISTVAADSTRQIIVKADNRVVEKSADIISQLHSYLKQKNLDKCDFFVSEVVNKVKIYLDRIHINNTGDSISNHITKIGKEITNIIKKTYQKYHYRSLKIVMDSIVKRQNELNVVSDLIIKNNQFEFPPAEFKNEIDSTPVYRDEFITMATETTAKQKDFTLTLTDKKTKAEIIKTDTYRTSPGHRITASLGIAYIFSPFRRSDAVVTNGVVTNTPDEDQVRLLSGIHFHLYPILLTDDRFIFKMKERKDIASRISLFFGVSYPKPLYNLHPGISVDLWPGVTLTYGAHFYRYTGYEILNNQITDQHSRYIYNGTFLSLGIEPVTFVKLIGLLK